ncbi:sulfite exporter TauE/SafE family protein [candidate division WWE3 bacterium]|uniref:Sulfite exporter TauE/SafE family protein n=1 Tax=candidate division WWE3 bacterium TaxID=2053526 RepID=A0A955LK34_UNCKA|nr:sulfite exporter TauE/SafE family protein [candidate division WWE3 bacterium]
MPELTSLIIPTFFAGILTFLAPCTFPLVPGYISFISGVTSKQHEKSTNARTKRLRVLANSASYMLGFSAVFIFLGTIFAFGGAALSSYRINLMRVGGVFVIFFGLTLMNIIRLPEIPALNSSRFTQHLKPGSVFSSFLFGAIFAAGWSPCVGPVLGTVLTLAASTATVASGAFLLVIFSLGFSLPFLAVALTLDSAMRYVKVINKYLRVISFIGGLIIVLLGVTLVTNRFGVFFSFFYQRLNFLNFENLIDFL